MKTEMQRHALRAGSRAAIKTAVAVVFFTFLLAVYLSERTTQASLLSETPEAKPQAAATETDVALGLDHFNAHCASCHGATGKGDTELGKSLSAADLTSEKIQSRSSDELFRIISNGIPGKGMPAFGKSHTPAEIKQTILFLRRLPTLTDEGRAKIEAAIPPSARHKHPEGEAQHDHTTQPASGASTQKPATEEHHEITAPPAQPSQQQNMPGMQHQHGQQPAQTPSTATPQQAQPTPQQGGGHAGHQMQTPSGQSQQNVPTGPVMTLAEIERTALQNNPTLAQAEAAIRAAQGRRRQAGLWPNPVMGYQGEEFAFRAFSDKSEHFFFVEQDVLLGGKLKKSQRIFEQEIVQAEIESGAQKQRVLNTVRMLYYEALGAQRRVDLRTELARIARDAAKTTSELLNVGQADRPDYLESQAEARQVELDLINAQNEYDETWQLLGSVVGVPTMEPARLADDLETGQPKLDQAALMTTLLNESPDIKRARAEVERSQAVLARAKAERVPDLVLRGGIGYSTEFLETRNGPSGRRTGPEASVQIGLRLPLFNRNQGGIAAAQAEVTIAERDLQRTQLALRVRLAQAFRDYNNAVAAVQRYRETILPRTERAYQLYLASFQQMSASYPQVLISQRTMFQVRENYLDALVNLRQNAIQIEGFLLTGALDAPRMRPSEGEQQRVEMTDGRSGSQGRPRSSGRDN